MLDAVGSDFGQFSAPDILFTPDDSNQALCHTIPIIDDSLAESTEMFLVLLNTNSSNVLLGPPIQVTIFDNDGELQIICHRVVCTSLIAASVGLEMGSYAVDEGSGPVEVCMVSSPELHKLVEVELVTVKHSAGESK